MKIEHKKNYTLISPTQNDFKQFFDNFKGSYPKLKEKHVIILLSKNFNITEKEILLFSKFSELHKNCGTSFVIVYPEIDIDNFPETFNIVPTLIEAEDVLEMENIERDLGF